MVKQIQKTQFVVKHNLWEATRATPKLEKLKSQNDGISGILHDSIEVEKVCQENVSASESLLDDAALLTQVASKLSDLSLVMSATVKKAESIEGINHSDSGGEAELF